MKSFFEFYEKLKHKTLSEVADAMVPPNTGMGAAAGTAMSPMPDMGAMGMGAPGEMNLGGAPTGAAVGGEAPAGDIQPQTAAPEGEVDAAGIYGFMDQMKEFLDRFATEEDDEKAELKDDLIQKLDAIKNDFISLTGVEPPKAEKEEDGAEDEMGGQQPAEGGAGLEQMTPAEAEGGGAPAGGMPGMPAPAAPSPAGGMGGPAMGGGGGFFGM